MLLKFGAVDWAGAPRGHRLAGAAGLTPHDAGSHVCMADTDSSVAGGRRPAHFMRHHMALSFSLRRRDPNVLCRDQLPPLTAIPDVYWMTTGTVLTRNGTDGITPNDVMPDPNGAPTQYLPTKGGGQLQARVVMCPGAGLPKAKADCINHMLIHHIQT